MSLVPWRTSSGECLDDFEERVVGEWPLYCAGNLSSVPRFTERNIDCKLTSASLQRPEVRFRVPCDVAHGGLPPSGALTLLAGSNAPLQRISQREEKGRNRQRKKLRGVAGSGSLPGPLLPLAEGQRSGAGLIGSLRMGSPTTGRHGERKRAGAQVGVRGSDDLAGLCEQVAVQYQGMIVHSGEIGGTAQ